tara:strand:- start:757 stop:1245 length:489 start_codon:yes stop_codon:yes gene_type:complete
MVVEKEQIISDTILIKSSNIKNNIDGYIQYYMKNKYEDKCYENGYIIPNSLEIVNRSYGKLTMIDDISYLKYEITYKVKSIIPTVGDIYTCTVDNLTKMGALGYLDYNSCILETSPIIFIIPNESLKDNDNISIGDKLRVKILDIRIKFMKKQIQVVAEINT